MIEPKRTSMVKTVHSRSSRFWRGFSFNHESWFFGEFVREIHLHVYQIQHMPHVIKTLQTFSWTKNYTLRMSVLECWTYTLQQSHKTCISGTKASLWPLSLPNSTQWPNADRWLHPVQAYLSSSNWMASSKPFNRHWTNSLMGMR